MVSHRGSERMIPGIVASGYVEVATGPAFRSASSTTTTSSTMTCLMPAGIAAGDILILQSLVFFDAKAGSAPSNPSGWTLRGADGSGSGDGWYWRVLTKTAGASESSVTQTGSNWFAGSMSIVAVSGASAVDVVGAISGNSLVAPSVTTTTNTDLLIGLWINSKLFTPVTITVPATMTSRVTTTVTNTWALFTNVGTETLAASGATGTRTATESGSPAYRESMLLAVK